MARMDDGLLDDYYEYSDRKQTALLGGVILPTYKQPPLPGVVAITPWDDRVDVPDRANIIKTQGHKDDSDKPRYDLIPPEVLEALAVILGIGAKKYSDRNWEKGMDWGRPFGALMRHMWAWWKGESNDPETGKSHLWHAACNIAFLISYEQRKAGRDNRP